MHTISKNERVGETKKMKKEKGRRRREEEEEEEEERGGEEGEEVGEDGRGEKGKRKNETHRAKQIQRFIRERLSPWSRLSCDCLHFSLNSCSSFHRTSP